jgi:hypothetical protein
MGKGLAPSWGRRARLVCVSGACASPTRRGAGGFHPLRENANDDRSLTRNPSRTVSAGGASPGPTPPVVLRTAIVPAAGSVRLGGSQGPGSGRHGIVALDTIRLGERGVWWQTWPVVVVGWRSWVVRASSLVEHDRHTAGSALTRTKARAGSSPMMPKCFRGRCQLTASRPSRPQHCVGSTAARCSACAPSGRGGLSQRVWLHAVRVVAVSGWAVGHVKDHQQARGR